MWICHHPGLDVVQGKSLADDQKGMGTCGGHQERCDQVNQRTSKILLKSGGKFPHKTLHFVWGCGSADDDAEAQSLA